MFAWPSLVQISLVQGSDDTELWLWIRGKLQFTKKKLINSSGWESERLLIERRKTTFICLTIVLLVTDNANFLFINEYSTIIDASYIHTQSDIGASIYFHVSDWATDTWFFNRFSGFYQRFITNIWSKKK